MISGASRWHGRSGQQDRTTRRPAVPVPVCRGPQQTGPRSPGGTGSGSQGVVRLVRRQGAHSVDDERGQGGELFGRVKHTAGALNWPVKFPADGAGSGDDQGDVIGDGGTGSAVLLSSYLARIRAISPAGGGEACITSVRSGRVPVAQPRSTCNCACPGLRLAARDPGGVFPSDDQPGGVMAASVFLRSVSPAVRSGGR
jgi:hypothetical protein